MHSFHANMILNKLMDLLVCVHDDEEKAGRLSVEKETTSRVAVCILIYHQRISDDSEIGVRPRTTVRVYVDIYGTGLPGCWYI